MTTQKEETSSLVVEIPKTLHRQAKMYALQHDMNLRAVVIAALTAYLEKGE